MLVGFALVGALTVGVFIGMSIRREQYEKMIRGQQDVIRHRDELIIQLEKLIGRYRNNSELHEQRHRQMLALLKSLGMKVPDDLLSPGPGKGGVH